MTGVILEKGPADWQILQQQDGRAELETAGSWSLKTGTGPAEVYARVVLEDSGETVVPWTLCGSDGQGRWKSRLSVPAGGLYRLETCLNHGGAGIEWSDRGDMIRHLGVGDNFVIAGQSNASGFGRDAAYDPPELGVHLLKNDGCWDIAAHPFSDSTRSVHEINTERINAASSPCLSFGKRLKRKLGYPIGLIQTSLGGSPLSRWNPAEDGDLYRNMLDVIASQGGRVRGILWYQGGGDAEADKCDTYLERFRHFVESLRKDLNDEDLPLLTIQENRDTRPFDAQAHVWYAKIREAQRRAAGLIPHVFVTSALDCALSDLVHNSAASNIALGERLAGLALGALYGERRYCEAPDADAARLTGRRTVTLTFRHVYDRLYCFEAGPRDLAFHIEDGAGEAGIAAYAVQGGNSLVFTLERELQGKAWIHGAHDRNPKGIIPVDAASHIPMLAFYGLEIGGTADGEQIAEDLK